MVRSEMSPSQNPTVGDRVGVPWGLDVLEGVILRTYETATGTRAVVSVDVPGADDEPNSRTVTLPVADLLPVGEGHGLDAPGSWVNEYQFSKAVQTALTRVVRRLAKRAEIDIEPRLGRLRPDAIVRLGDHLVVVEAKRTTRLPAALNQLAAYIHEVRENNPHASVEGLLVLQSEREAQIPFELLNVDWTAVNWNTPSDDPALSRELARLLE